MKVIVKKCFLFVLLLLGLLPIQAGWQPTLAMPTLPSLPWLSSFKTHPWITPVKSFLEDHQKPLLIGGTCLSVVGIGGYLLYKKLKSNNNGLDNLRNRRFDPSALDNADGVHILLHNHQPPRPAVVPIVVHAPTSLPSNASPSTSGSSISPIRDTGAGAFPPNEFPQITGRKNQKITGSSSTAILDARDKGKGKEPDTSASEASRNCSDALVAAQQEILTPNLAEPIHDLTPAAFGINIRPLTELAQEAVSRNETQNSSTQVPTAPKSARSLEYDEMIALERTQQEAHDRFMQSSSQLLTEEEENKINASIDEEVKSHEDYEAVVSPSLKDEILQAENPMMQSGYHTFTTDEGVSSSCEVDSPEIARADKGKEVEGRHSSDADSDSDNETRSLKTNSKIPAWEFETFTAFAHKCAALKPYQLPKFRGHDKNNNEIAVSYEEFDRAFDHYFEVIRYDNVFNNHKNWVQEKYPRELIESLKEEERVCWQPFVSKLVVEAGKKIAIHGDIHGDIHSLVNYIQDLCNKGYINPETLEIKDPDFYMLFLGDLVDRGWYGVEVMYLIMRLKSANPHRVFITRGNHEDFSMSAKEGSALGVNGFFAQIVNKYEERFALTASQSPEIYKKISKFYETLPLALYLGCKDSKSRITNYFLCCHGGNELGFEPYKLFQHNSNIAFTCVEQLKRRTYFERIFINIAKIIDDDPTLNSKDKARIHDLVPSFMLDLNDTLRDYVPTSIMTPINGLYHLIGFQWNDYDTNKQSKADFLAQQVHGRGWMLGEYFSNIARLAQSTSEHILRGVFRAHQHSPDPKNPMMRRMLNTDNMGHNCNKGLAHIWNRRENPHELKDNDVITFCVSPNAHCQKLLTRTCQHSNKKVISETYGLLTTDEDFDKWELKVHTIEMDLPSEPIIDISSITNSASTSNAIIQPVCVAEVKEDLNEEMAEFVEILVPTADQVADEFVMIEDTQIQIPQRMMRLLLKLGQNSIYINS